MMAPVPDRVVVPLRKGGFVKVIVSTLFVVLGSVLLLIPRGPTAPPHHPMLIVLSVFGIFFFGFAGLFAARKLFDRTPALVLDAEGVVDNSSALAAGRVRWDEITQIRVIQVVRHRYLSISVRDPRRFLERGGSLRRKLNRANFEKVGTPINIKATTLAMPFDAVVDRVTEFYRAYGTPA